MGYDLALPVGGHSPMLQLKDPNAEFRVTSMMRLAKGGAWRTEAQRCHVRPLLLWFTRGQGRITVAGATRGFGPHNAVFIPGGTMHGFSMMGQVLGAAILFPETLASDLPDEPLHLRLRDGIHQAELTRLVDEMERESTGDRPASKRALLHWGGLVSVWLERHADLAEDLPAVSAPQKLFSAYTAMIERKFQSGLGVSGYAEQLGITPTHLNRVCRQSAGKCASRLLSERVHYEARRLLTESEIPVKDIARRLGFNSAAYFSRAFLNETGMSPTQYRRQG